MFQYPKDIVGERRGCVEGARLGYIDYIGFAPVYREYGIDVSLLEASDGVKTVVVLISSVVDALKSGKKLILLIDEFEQHLHPELQIKLWDYLSRKAWGVVATTHSIYTLYTLAANKLLTKIYVTVKQKDHVALRELKVVKGQPTESVEELESYLDKLMEEILRG